MNSYYGLIKDPLREALTALTNEECPFDLQGHLTFPEKTNEGVELINVQAWAKQHAKPRWATGESILDAAELIVYRATENNNIHTSND